MTKDEEDLQELQTTNLKILGWTFQDVNGMVVKFHFT